MHKYTRSQRGFRHEKSVMGVWFSNLVELIKIKAAVSCVNWELQVNLVLGLGKRAFCAGELLPLVESRHAGAVRRSMKCCHFLDDSVWGTVWNLETHTHTHSQAWPCKHGKHPCSLGFMPGNLACWEEIFRSEKSLPSQSLIIIALCSLIWLFRNPCTALI